MGIVSPIVPSKSKATNLIITLHLIDFPYHPASYEQPGFTPLVAKESRGHSMPSRHALSAAVLAAVWLYFYPAAGCVMVGVALLICCLRVLTGVHHVRDVVCGFALGFALGCAGMWLL